MKQVQQWRTVPDPRVPSSISSGRHDGSYARLVEVVFVRFLHTRARPAVVLLLLLLRLLLLPCYYPIIT